MIIPNPAAQRIVLGAPATLDVYLTDQDGEPTSSAGTVTVHVTRGDGTDVLAAGTGTVNDTANNPGRYTAAITSVLTGSLDRLACDWSDGAAIRKSTGVDIVGGVYCTVAELRAWDTSLQDVDRYPVAKIQRVRTEVEQQIERITGCAFVPRYRRFTFDGRYSPYELTPTDTRPLDAGVLVAPDTRLRKVRSVWVYSDPTTYYVYTSTDLADIYVTEGGTIERRSRGAWFPSGFGHDITIEYEHGYDRPPADVKHAAMTLLRYRLNAELTGLPDRAQSFTLTDGGTFRLAMPGEDATGIPEVDAILDAYTEKVPSVA